MFGSCIPWLIAHCIARDLAVVFPLHLATLLQRFIVLSLPFTSSLNRTRVAWLLLLEQRSSRKPQAWVKCFHWQVKEARLVDLAAFEYGFHTDRTQATLCMHVCRLWAMSTFVYMRTGSSCDTSAAGLHRPS